MAKGNGVRANVLRDDIFTFEHLSREQLLQVAFEAALLARRMSTELTWAERGRGFTEWSKLVDKLDVEGQQDLPNAAVLKKLGGA